MNFMPTSRLLPLLLFVAFVALGVRVGDFWSLASGNGGFRFMQTSIAEEPNKPEEHAAAEPKPEAKPAAPSPEAGKADPQKPLDNVEKPPETGKPAGEEAAPAGEEKSAPEVSDKLPDELTPAEMDVLQNLATRRKEIEQRARNLDTREALIAAAEQRVDQKVKELQGLREELKGLLRQIDEQQQARVDSLVKIYETMKPREAAAVIEGLDINVALDVIERMKETKTAPVLAAMTPQKAGEITAKMMQRQKLPDLPTN